jgi:hypothetical protein
MKYTAKNVLDMCLHLGYIESVLHSNVERIKGRRGNLLYVGSCLGKNYYHLKRTGEKIMLRSFLEGVIAALMGVILIICAIKLANGQEPIYTVAVPLTVPSYVPKQPLCWNTNKNIWEECRPVINNNNTPTEDKPKLNLAAKWPHPYLQTGLSLNGTSESTVSVNGIAGLDIEEKHFLSETFALYDTKHKDAPGISPSSKGRQRAFGGTAFYKQGNWQYGVGAEFSQFAITEYTKQDAFGFAGAGRDWTDLTRVQVMYFHAINERTKYPDGSGCACTNGVQGIRFNMWMPNPATSHHWFFVIDFQPYWFHTTVTDPGNKQLTAMQESQHSVDSTLKLDLRYRF